MSSVLTIQSDLAGLFSNDGNKDQDNSRSARHNIAIVVSDKYDRTYLEDLITGLCIVRPSRIFILTFDNSLTEIAVRIAPRCHKLSSLVSICSEVIYLSIPQNKFMSIPSILLANFISGTKSELFLLDASSDKFELLDPLLPLFGQIFIDSSNITNDEIVRKILCRKTPVVDFTWVRLSPWREAVVELFYKVDVSIYTKEDSIIEITAFSTYEAGLLAGWIVSRLCLKRSSNPSVYITRHAKQITFKINSSCPQQIVFRTNTSNSVVLAKKMEHNIAIFSNSSLLGAKPLDDDRLASLVKRYFLVGESTQNFKDSVNNSVYEGRKD